MSLKAKEFHTARSEAMQKRKARIVQRTRAEFEILDEIAKALKTTSQVAGKIYDFIININMVQLAEAELFMHWLVQFQRNVN
jgi:nitrogen regulatory protein PII